MLISPQWHADGLSAGLVITIHLFAQTALSLDAFSTLLTCVMQLSVAIALGVDKKIKQTTEIIRQSSLHTSTVYFLQRTVWSSFKLSKQLK